MEAERDFQEVADEYGRRVVAGLREELAAVEHAEECDGDAECEFCIGAGDLKGEECAHCGGTGEVNCRAGADSDYPESWHNKDDARQRIDESPLSLEVRSGWTSLGSEMEAEEYCILLGTGGPAARIRGELSQYGEPTSAAFEYQDWFKPWTEARLSDDEESTLLEWAQHFSFESGR